MSKTREVSLDTLAEMVVEISDLREEKRRLLDNAFQCVFFDQRMAEKNAEIARLQDELSAFKAAHDIGQPKDGYRELIWREAAAHFEAEAAKQMAEIERLRAAVREAFKPGWMTNAVPPEEHPAGVGYVRSCEEADWQEWQKADRR